MKCPIMTISKIMQSSHSHRKAPHPEDISPVTWISAVESAFLLNLTIRTVLNRAAEGKLPAIIPEDTPLTTAAEQNYLIRLEGLPHNAQLKYLRSHLPADQTCAVDLTSPRSSFGDVWILQFLGISQLIREADRIQRKYRHTGNVTELLRKLAESNGISLPALYRLCGKDSSKEISMLYLDPIYLEPHLPKTMCLWSADFAYAYSWTAQNSIHKTASTENYRKSPTHRAVNVLIIRKMLHPINLFVIPVPEQSKSPITAALSIDCFLTFPLR